MKKYINWLFKSNRPTHTIVGFVLGLILGIDCVVIAAFTAEIKDWMWSGSCGGRLGWIKGNGFDWLDFAATMIGGLVGFGIRNII